MSEGYITLSRGFFQTAQWRAPRTFNESEAWLDCIQSARFELSGTMFRVGGREVRINRGEWAASQRFLAKRWQWSEMKVRLFLERLKKAGMIETESRDGVTVIRLVNYDKYNQTPDNAADNAVNSAANELTIKEMIASITQQIAQLTAQVADLQRTDNANPNKEKEYLKKDCPNGQPKESGGTPMSAQPTHGQALDYDSFIRFYNSTMSDSAIPPIKSLSDSRRAMLGARLKEYGKDAITEVVRKAAVSSFLNGGGDRAFIASFDWIFRPGNFLKILEGNYDDKHYINGDNKRRTSEDYVRESMQAGIEETLRFIQEAKRARGEV